MARLCQLVCGADRAARLRGAVHGTRERTASGAVPFRKMVRPGSGRIFWRRRRNRRRRFGAARKRSGGTGAKGWSQRIGGAVLGQVGKRWSAAKELWLRLLGAFSPYERALVHAQLALLLLRSDSASDAADGKRHAVLCGQILDEIADDYESQNQRALALDCYRVLSQFGEASGAFENVAKAIWGCSAFSKASAWSARRFGSTTSCCGSRPMQGNTSCAPSSVGMPRRFCIAAVCHIRPALFAQRGGRSCAVADVRLRAGAVRLAEHALLSAADLLSTLSAPDRLHRVLEQFAALRSDVAERSRYQRLAELIDTAGAPARSDLGKPAAKSVETLPGSASQRRATGGLVAGLAGMGSKPRRRNWSVCDFA